MRTRVGGALIALLIVMTGCANQKRVSETATLRNEYAEANAVACVAWQYIVDCIDKMDTAVSDAVIDRLEYVETIECSNESSPSNIEVYALKYSIFVDKNVGWISNETDRGDPFLYIVSDNGIPKIVDIEIHDKYLVGQQRNISVVEIDYSKQSVSDGTFSDDEINAALSTVKAYLDTVDCVQINTWFDNTVQESIAIENADNSLYGIKDAINEGNFIVVLSDLYAKEPVESALNRSCKFFLLRNSEQEPWSIVSKGY